jgi:hypothetical protein
MNLKMKAVRAVAWGLRNLPKVTNFAADKLGKRLAPIVEKKTGRAYKLGQTRYEAKIYNFIKHPTPEQKEEEAQAIQAGHDLFWSDLEAYLPTPRDVVDSAAEALVSGYRSESLPARRNAIRRYVDDATWALAQMPHGRETVINLRSEIPEDVRRAMISINSREWFEDLLRSCSYEASRRAKSPWDFWDAEKAENLPRRFYTACRFGPSWV